MYKVAVIEDDQSIQLMYKMKLELEGFEVFTASNGQDGLALLQQKKPNLALVDIRMPVMTGDAMLEQLRESEWGAKIRIIVLTNVSRDEAPSVLRFLNVDRYIVKAHHTPSQVADIVNEILK